MKASCKSGLDPRFRLVDYIVGFSKGLPMKELRTFRGRVLAISGCLAVAFTGPAHALTFDFSFTGTSFPSCNGSPTNCINGTVTGTILGLSNGTSTGIVEITSFPSDLVGLTTALDTPIPGIMTEDNFTVTAGVLTHADFISANSELSLKTLTDGTTCTVCYLQAFSAKSQNSVESATSITFTPDVTTTPLPAALPLLCRRSRFHRLSDTPSQAKRQASSRCCLAEINN